MIFSMPPIAITFAVVTHGTPAPITTGRGYGSVTGRFPGGFADTRLPGCDISGMRRADIAVMTAIMHTGISAPKGTGAWTGRHDGKVEDIWG